METVTISKEEYEALQRKAQRKGHGWQVMNASTGLFSTGGRYPRWTKGGKVYSAKGHVLSHLRMLISDLNHENRIFESYSDYSVGENRLADEIWAQSRWYHPEDWLPSCWRVIDPEGNELTIAEAFADSMTHYRSHYKVKGIPEEWKR